MAEFAVGDVTPPDQTTGELQQLLARAELISENTSDEATSFTSFLLAFLTAPDPISRWFQEYIADSKVDPIAIMLSKGLDPALLDKVTRSSKADNFFLERSPGPITRSAHHLFLSAEEMMEKTATQPEGGLLDVRHLMGAYIYRPGGHDTQLAAWGFDHADWSLSFLEQIRFLNPDELPLWRDIHAEAFVQVPPSGIAGLEAGFSTHIASDLWTVDDDLGYADYAYAISRFVTDDRTQSPLTISIQASWGGGKTSLMRMIQRNLDPRPVWDNIERARAPAEIEKKQQYRLKLGTVLKDLKSLLVGGVPDFKISEAQREDLKLLTIWFNPWKYESTKQVWAGLGDAIIRQFAARLGRKDRERFWFHLHLKRIDADKLREEIYGKIGTLWRRLMAPWITGLLPAGLISGFAALAGTFLASLPLLQVAGLGGVLASAAVGSTEAFLSHESAKKTVSEEPAENSLSDYVRVPDYSEEMGFVHSVEEDLERVFGLIPEEYLPLVIFIDDLDRCSPPNVAKVFEAINLFLAGQFRNCIFLIGMDPDIVATAMEVAHGELVSQLPADATGTPLGWRFMDKFVQLPFAIPPPLPDDLTRYTSSLMTDVSEISIDLDPLESMIEPLNREELDGEAALSNLNHELAERGDLTPEQRSALLQVGRGQVRKAVMDRYIESYSDRESEVRKQVLEGSASFSQNPREMKRFINMFRFLYFLSSVRIGGGEEAPTLDQIRRWIILVMKWPRVARWIRRGHGMHVKVPSKKGTNVGAKVSVPALKLSKLEDIASKAENLEEWLAGIKSELRLSPANTAWTGDESLFRFFKEEAADIRQRHLSEAAGKGLW